MEETPNNPDQPATAEPAAAPQATKKKKKPPFKLALIAGLVLLLGGAAAAYTVVQNNDPDAAWQQALNRTADGFDTITEKAVAEPQKGGTLSGSFNVSSPIVADGTLTGSWYESDLQASGEVGILGLRTTSEIRAITAAGSAYPDIYLKVDGLAGLDVLLGVSNPALGELVSGVNDQWFVIDRTLISQATTNAESTEMQAEMPTAEDAADLAEKTSAVLRDRLFTDDPEKAVVVVDQYLGKEDFDGADTFAYSVRVQKEQFRAFVTEMKDAIGQTAFAQYLIDSSGNPDANLEEVLGFDALQEEIEKQDFTDATAKAWVDARGKFIRNIRITDPGSEDGSTYIDFGMPYSGGDDLPFTITLNSTDGEDTGVIELSLTYGQETSVVELGFDVAVSSQANGDIQARGSLTIEGSDEELSLEAPTDARNILELMSVLNNGTSPDSLSELDAFSGTEGLPFDDFEL